MYIILSDAGKYISIILYALFAAEAMSMVGMAIQGAIVEDGMWRCFVPAMNESHIYS